MGNGRRDIELEMVGSESLAAERGRSYIERCAGALGGRGNGGFSKTAWYHAGSSFRRFARKKRAVCLCTWPANLRGMAKRVYDTPESRVKEIL